MEMRLPVLYTCTVLCSFYLSVMLRWVTRQDSLSSVVHSQLYHVPQLRAFRLENFAVGQLKCFSGGGFQAK